MAIFFYKYKISFLSLSWLALGLAGSGSGWLGGWLGGWQLLLLVGWLAIGLASCSWLAAWLTAGCVADEADERDDSGCGWLAGNQTKNPRNVSLSINKLKIYEKKYPEEAPAGRGI